MVKRTKSWAKGRRGELYVAKKVGGKRTGHAFVSAPDITSKFAAYSVKFYQPTFPTILEELEKLSKLAPDKNHYVVFNIGGNWLVIETLNQHRGDHGEYIQPEVANDELLPTPEGGTTLPST